MKFQYDLDRVIAALNYYDIKGIIKIMDNHFFAKGEPSLSEMEVILKDMFNKLPPEEHKIIERYILSCARENSTGY